MVNTGLLLVACLEDRNMSFMLANFAAAEREAACGIARGAGAVGLAGPEGSCAAKGAAGFPPGAAGGPAEVVVGALAAAGREVCLKRSSAPSLHDRLIVAFVKGRMQGAQSITPEASNLLQRCAPLSS